MKHMPASLTQGAVLGAAVLVLLLAPGCGGEKAQTPGPESPEGTPTGTGTGETAPAATATATDTGTAAPAEPAPKASQSEMQRDAIRTMAAAFNAHDSRRIASLYSPDTRLAGAGPSGWVEQTGTASVEEGYNRLFAAFPDMRWASPRVYMANNVVVQEWALSGTHRGNYGSMPATDKPAGVHGASVYWFDDYGRIKQQHTYYDAAAMDAQIGATKARTRPVPALPVGEPQIITATGTGEDNRYIDEAAAFYDTFEKRDERAYLGAFGKDAMLTSYLMPEDRKGERAARDDFRAVTRAFPDVQVTAKNLWGFGDRVLAEVVMTGTQSNDYQGVKATKKPGTLHTLDILRFDENGKIVEMTSYGTLMELSPQPAPQPGGMWKGGQP